MANIADVSYVVFGPEDQVSELHRTMAGQLKKAGPLRFKDLAALYGVPADCGARSHVGRISPLQLDGKEEPHFYMYAEEPWGADDQFWEEFLAKARSKQGNLCFSDLKFRFLVIEPGMDVFYNSDSELRFFKAQYQVELMLYLSDGERIQKSLPGLPELPEDASEDARFSSLFSEIYYWKAVGDEKVSGWCLRSYPESDKSLIRILETITGEKHPTVQAWRTRMDEINQDLEDSSISIDPFSFD